MDEMLEEPGRGLSRAFELSDMEAQRRWATFCGIGGARLVYMGKTG